MMEEKRIVVYVIGAYSKPDPCINTNNAVKLGDVLWEKGFAPLIPHLIGHLWHTISPHPYQMWIDLHLELMKKCDAVLWDKEYTPGASPGGENEWKVAGELGIPRFSSIKDLEALEI